MEKEKIFQPENKGQIVKCPDNACIHRYSPLVKIAQVVNKKLWSGKGGERKNL